VEDTAVTTPSPDAPAREPADTRARLVLIVDDNEKNLKLTRDVLRFAGFRTIEATSGAEGIALAGEHQPDVILMDLRLSDMSGADAARTLSEGTRTARIPVVALSSLPLERRDAWVLGNAFAGYLEKPFDVGKLPAQVRGYCLEGA
jgi:two-component system cell cycle response regulator DivK